jgi:hypothetical protein
MERDKLAETLRQLHVDLSAAQHVGPEERVLLATLTDDIDRLLEKGRDASASDLEPVTIGLHDLVRKFEADHPALSTSVGRVADALAAMGF